MLITVCWIVRKILKIAAYLTSSLFWMIMLVILPALPALRLWRMLWSVFLWNRNVVILFCCQIQKISDFLISKNQQIYSWGTFFQNLPRNSHSVEYCPRIDYFTWLLFTKIMCTVSKEWDIILYGVFIKNISMILRIKLSGMFCTLFSTTIIYVLLCWLEERMKHHKTHLHTSTYIWTHINTYSHTNRSTKFTPIDKHIKLHYRQTS